MNNLLNDFSTNDKFINEIFNLGDSIQKDVEMNLSRIFFSYKIFNTKKRPNMSYGLIDSVYLNGSDLTGDEYAYYSLR